MQDIIIVGAGGFGREVLALLKNCNAITPAWNVLGFVDDGKTAGEIVNGFTVLGGVEYINQLQKPVAVCIAISLPEVRKAIAEQITNPHVAYPTLIHPSVIISDDEYVEMGKGCVLCINTVLTVNIRLGDFVIMNAGAIINHDAVIRSYSTIMPGVNISTGAQVGEGCYIGTGSKISKPEVITPWQKLSAGTIIA
ncbi:MAG: acetyltransferase [Bacteroidetes bacterium]|nr:MAG: acetyltransferase [Bacteroidota bacterium]